MRNLKYIFVASFIVCSFFLADKAMIYINSKNPIMQEINSKRKEYEIEAVNAIVKDNTIIPGINGSSVDIQKSFNKMDSLGYFNELFLVYNQVNPKNSIKDHKDKIIIKGNPAKNMVSLIVSNNKEVSSYLDNLNIDYTILASTSTYLSTNKEYIIGEANNKLFLDLNTILNRKKVNSNICLINYSNINLCQKKKYYLVNYSINLNDNLVDNLNKLSSGDIIFIDNNTSLYNVKNIINEINRLDLKIEKLSKLISEES